MRLVSKNERNRTVAPFPEQESADSSGNNLPAHASDRSSNVEGLPLSGDGYSVSGNDLAAGDKALSIRSAYVLEGEDEVPPINDSSSDVADRTRSRSAQHDDDIALHSSGEARGFTDGSEKGRHSSSHQDSAGKAPVDARSSRNGSNIQEPSFGETRRESGREDTSEQNIESVNRRRHYSGSPLHREMEESTLGMEFLRIASRPRGPEARFEEAKRIGTQTIRHHKHRHRDTIPDYSSSRRHEHGDSRFQDDHIERSRPAMMTGRYTDRIGDQPSSYQKPVTRLREPLSFDVPLDGTQGDRLTLEPWDWYNRPLKNARKYSTRLLHILKATKLVDEAGKHRINLKYHANVSESDANLPISIKWLSVDLHALYSTKADLL